MEIEVKKISDLKKVIDCINESGKKIIVLSGNLGSGKTTLVKEFAKSKGIKQTVSSPTFSIQNVYDDEIRHYDLYNKTLEEFVSLGMLEELEKEGFHFIEWGEKIERALKDYGFEYLKIEIKTLEGKRIFKCQD
jgi:tRNA threonylcarbamoyladenosine biosynthesis protein TsaE